MARSKPTREELRNLVKNPLGRLGGPRPSPWAFFEEEGPLGKIGGGSLYKVLGPMFNMLRYGTKFKPR